MGNTASQRRPLLLAFLSAALFGAATPICKTLLSSFPAFQLAGLLYLGASAGVSPVVLLRRELTAPWRLGKRNSLYLAGSLFFGGVLAPVFLLFGLRLASGASVSMWLTMEAMATAVLGVLLFREQLGKRGWFAVAGTIGSALLLALGGGTSGMLAGLLVCFACICWGLDNNLQALLDGISPAQTTFWKGSVAGTVNLAIGLAAEHFTASAVAITASLIVGALSYGASLVLYIGAAQKLGATRSQMIFAGAPFFGVLISATWLGEGITAIDIGAALLFGISLAVLFRDQHAHEHMHEALDHIHEHTHDDGHHDHEHEGMPASLRHTHRHQHTPRTHTHRHLPDLHHRHRH